jgi:2-polyprenyl-3-methyl-5-hydroxy-6-metoxy-1,4-benzoquinol methylase
LKRQKKLKGYGSRDVELSEDRLEGVEEMHLYAFASQFVAGKRVLHIASGEGYGSFILSRAAQEVVGIELDPENVAYAERRYKRKNIKYILGSLEDMPVDDMKRFDVIVCIQALGKVHDLDKCLSGAKHFLLDEGLLIFSINEEYFNKYNNIFKSYLTNIFYVEQTACVGLETKPLSETAVFSQDRMHALGNAGLKSKQSDGEKINNIIAMGSISPQVIDLAKIYADNASNTSLESFSDQLLALTARADMLEKCLMDRDIRIDELEDKLRCSKELVHELKGMQGSVVWQLLMKYQFGFVDRALPQGTWRREKYDFILNCIRILFYEGLSSFCKKMIFPAGNWPLFGPQAPGGSASEPVLDRSEGGLLVHHHELPLEAITIADNVELRKGQNRIKFHIGRGCGKHFDAEEKNCQGCGCSGLEIRNVSIMDGDKRLPLNFDLNWKGIEDLKGGPIFYLSRDATVIVESASTCVAKLVFDAKSPNHPTVLEIYAENGRNECAEKKQILLRDAEIKADRYTLKNELEDILNGLKGKILL